MRNYLQTFWARTEWDFDFNPPNPPLHRQQYLFAPTNDDLQFEIKDFFEGLAADPQNINMTIVRQGPVYWLMDKTNLFYSLDHSHVALKDEGFTEDMILFKTDPDFESPRDGWKDVSGVDRKAPPSEDSGLDAVRKATHNVQVTPLQLLGMLYAQLLAAGRPDLAALLLPFVAAIAAGKDVGSVTVKNAFGQKLTFQQVLDLIDAALA